jgi:peptidoglycan-associated lipoprotein
MPHLNPKHLRQLLLVMMFMAVAIALTACGGKENVRSAGNMPEAGAQGQQGQGGQANGAGGRREVNVRGLEGIPEGDRSKFTDPDNPLSTRTLYFAFDSNEIKSKYENVIKAHAHYLANHSKVHLRLEGNTDERGTREYNIALGERRADAVKQALVLSGASAGQISTISYGEERPAVLGHNEAAYAKNRRVQLIYTNH